MAYTRVTSIISTYQERISKIHTIYIKLVVKTQLKFIALNCTISHLIFYYIPLYLTDMEQVSSIMQCIKHMSYHTVNKN